MALVELYRITGERRYLALAARFDRSARRRAAGDRTLRAGLLAGPRPGARCDDRGRSRRAPAVPRLRRRGRRHRAGRHAAARGGRASLARHGRDADVPDRRARQSPRDESFGDPFELPPDRRLRRDMRLDRERDARLAAPPGDRRPGVRRRRSSGRSTTGSCRACRSTGRASSTSTPCSGGRSERRTDRGAANARRGTPAPVARPTSCALLSSWPQYLATADADGIQLHQFATAELHVPVADGTARLAMETGYPWDGTVRVTVIEAPAQPWTLSLRVPGWCRSGSLHAPGGERTPIASRATRGHGDADLGSLVTRSSWTSTCRFVRPCRTRASTRSGDAWRSSADRSSIASKRPTCRAMSSSRRSRSNPAAQTRPGARARRRRLGDRADGAGHPSPPWPGGRGIRGRAAGGDAGRGRRGPLLHVGEPIGRCDARLDPDQTDTATNRSRTAAPRSDAAHRLCVRPGPSSGARVWSARPPAGPSTGGPRASA